MKNNLSDIMKDLCRLLFIGSCCLLTFCTKEVVNIQSYTCDTNWENNSEIHPKNKVFQQFLDEKVAQGLPGVQMSVQTPDGKIWTGAAGKIDIANQVEFQPCHKSRIGSISKTFTAVVILKLVEEGKLELDAPMVNYLEGNIIKKIANGQVITLRQLLNHSSGIRDYTTIKGYTDFINQPTKVFTTEEYLKLNVYDRDELFAPGSSFEYSNANYGLLGMIAEKVTQKDLVKLYQDYIFTPLNLQNTYFNKQQPNPDFLARGYVDFHEDGKIFETSDWGVLTISPAAGIISNTHDLLVFEQALHNGELIKEETYQAMTTFIQVPDPDFNRTKYGLGLRYWETDYGFAYGHSGGMYGYLGEAFHFPESNVTYTLLVNCSFGICNEIVDEVLNEEVLELIFE